MAIEATAFAHFQICFALLLRYVTILISRLTTTLATTLFTLQASNVRECPLCR